MVKTDLKLVDLSLQSLLDTEGLTLGLLLSLQGGRHGLHGASVVLPVLEMIMTLLWTETSFISLPGVVELFLLLSHTPVNLLLDLSEFELGAEDLVLLLLEGALGLLQSSLELLLLLLQAAPLLVQVVDGAATLTELIQEILDLVSEILVLALGIEISKQCN